MRLIKKRVVLHFPGFEPLDGKAHRARYERTARQSGKAWGFQAQLGEIDNRHGFAKFDVLAASDFWQTESRIHVFDHDVLVEQLSAKPAAKRIVDGFAACGSIIMDGGLVGYFRHAWRFGLFFTFPFVLMLLGLMLMAVIALAPMGFGLNVQHMIWSLPAAAAFFYLFLSFAERFYTLHLFADWEMAVALGRMDRPEFDAWLERCATTAREALLEDADEYVISSHSMGSSVAAHVVGLLLEKEPALFDGKQVVFASLGSAVLQCALLSSAKALRARVGLIARCRSVFWLDVHCLTDAIHFYKVPVVAAAGHPDAPQARMQFIRVKQMLTPEHYKKIKLDFLRVHRQYVLGPDLRATFDFTLLTAGPVPAALVADGGLQKMPGL
ncbi:hypothetical protein EV130_11626 [Rhizobium azibense]|uniref:Transmembrane protein n=1 Tax=Rhizobium azibense TaxID=1136135 RepID=A0A4R3RA55_9HYPH|nr:hypothetical protein [Rhizobium azibense]TCU17578.1 hypothetical protein EV130_11626 [Rhizobium azibense]TCU31661.1 hypothetical protein EV129_12526 [Rhizobium azibense]